MKTAWWIVGITGRIIIGLFLLFVCFVFSIPYLSTLPFEFKDSSSDRAQFYIRHLLPAETRFDEIESASGKVYSSIDSRNKWLQITLKSDVAEKWQDAMHSQLEQPLSNGGSFDLVEGVHRSVAAPDLTVASMGNAPGWWKPPPLGFRITERMRWYKGDRSGYGDAVYTCCDPTTKTLWIFESSEQHHLLWSRGMVPQGDQFTVGKPLPKP